MQKFIFPSALAIALTAGAAAFAGSAPQAGNESIYGQPNPFAAVETPANHQVASDWNLGSQQASRIYVPQGDWQQQAPAAGDHHDDPE